MCSGYINLCVYVYLIILAEFIPDNKENPHIRVGGGGNWGQSIIGLGKQSVENQRQELLAERRFWSPFSLHTNTKSVLLGQKTCKF